jgi:hypothetical protein
MESSVAVGPTLTLSSSLLLFPFSAKIRPSIPKGENLILVCVSYAPNSRCFPPFLVERLLKYGSKKVSCFSMVYNNLEKLMEAINRKIALLLDDVQRLTQLLEDATVDAELLDSQPYQQARVLAFRKQLFWIELRLRDLQRELAAEERPLLGNRQKGDLLAIAESNVS